jgi:hypothetical protein
MSCNAWSISPACRVQKGGSRRGPFSLLARVDENLSDEDDDTPAVTPLYSIRTPLSHCTNLQKTQSATHARVGWKKVDFLLSPSFWAEIFSEQTPRIHLVGVVPAAQSTGRRIPVHKKQQLLDCLYVHKCREVRTRLRSSARGNLQPRPIIPRKEATFDAPTFFDTVLDGVRISKSSRLVVPGVDWGPSWRFFLGKSAHVLASSRFSSPSQRDTPLEHIGMRISC